MISHDVEFCAQYADRTGLFFQGNVVTSKDSKEFFAGNSFYTTAANRMARLIGLAIAVFSMCPFFLIFEGRKPQSRELLTIAVLIAIAVAGRAAFFMVPGFKPIVAVVIISGVSFGAESGFLVGSLSMLSSNMLFGQGPWTPWQMFAAGIIGFLAGILFQKGWLKARKISLCIYGFLATVFIYGGIMNPASLVMMSYTD